MQFKHFLLNLLQSLDKTIKIDEAYPYPMLLIRFIAREKGLAGSDNMEQAKIEEILETLAALENDGMSHMDFIDHLDKILSDMERQLVVNGGEFMVGQKMSMADLGVFVVLNQMKARSRANFPYLNALYIKLY